MNVRLGEKVTQKERIEQLLKESIGGTDYGRRSDKSSIAIHGGFIMITKNPMYFHCYLMIAKLVY